MILKMKIRIPGPLPGVEHEITREFSSKCGIQIQGAIPENRTFDERLKQLYPLVDEQETPLPRCWSQDEKYQFISLSDDKLRVHFTGKGKTYGDAEREASAVLTPHSIPVTSGIYYYEVTIMNKGRDGRIGIGLAPKGVNLNRLGGF